MYSACGFVLCGRLPPLGVSYVGPDTATDVVSHGNDLRPFAELRPGNALGVGFQWASGENLRICILLRMRVAKSSRCVYWRTCSARWTWPRPASIYATKDTGIRRYFQNLWNLCSLPHWTEQLRCKGWHAQGGQFYGRKGSKTTFRGTRRAAKRAKFVKLT